MRLIDADTLLIHLTIWRDSQTPSDGDFPHIRERQEIICRTITQAMDMVEVMAGERKEGDSDE